MSRIFLSFFLVAIVKITVFSQIKLDEPEIICVVDSTPNFPGGIDSLRKFFKDNLKFPEGQPGFAGRIFVSFIVNRDGSLSDFEVVKELHETFDKCALEAAKKLPKWIPAESNGKPLRSRMVIPITLRL